MQGALTLSAMAAFHNLKTLYEGSATAHESGGISAAVRTLTYDELVKFHDTYYHPSNALITLYGDLDINSFLEYIDKEYLSKFDKTDIEVDMGDVAPYTETKYAEYEVAVENGAVTKNASEIYYGLALNGADLADFFDIQLLTGVIFQESSPVMKTLREKLPNAQINAYLDCDAPSAPYMAFIAKGVDPEDRDAFVSAVDEGLALLAAEGISADALDSIIAAHKLSLLTMQENTMLGVDASLSISLGWTYFDSINYFPAYEASLNEMTKERADALMQKYIIDNPHRAVSVTKPVAGQTEQNAAALADELAKLKAGMSQEEIEALVNKSGEFMEWASTPTPAELVNKIGNIKAADLPEELRHYDVTDETTDGVRYMSAPADISGVFSGELFLDGSTIPVEYLQDVQTCIWLLGELDTNSHDKETLSTLKARYLPGFSRGLDSLVGYNDTSCYAAMFEWKGLTEDAEAATALLGEILFETDFSDTDTIKNLLTRWSSDHINDLDSNSLSLQLSRCFAMFNDYHAYRSYVNDYDMYAHMQELIALADSDPAKLTERLGAARTLLLNRAGATVLMTGNGDAIAAYRTGIENILGKMTNEARDKVDYSSLRIPARNEGVVVNSTVQMNVLLSDYGDYSGKDNVVSMLIDDMYLLPQLRSALGAYGAYSDLGRASSGLYTYRDPNLEGSYDIFAKLPEYLRTAELTQDDVDRYIIGSYSRLSAPLGPLSGAMRAIKDNLIGCSEEMRLQWMKDAKATTVEDIASSADTWDALVKNGVRSTSGTESALLAAGDLFNVLLYPDGTVKELSAALEPAA